MIGVLGISHKTAPLSIREVFSIDKSQINDFAKLIITSCEISELVVLSTCNRTEIYFYQVETDSGIFYKLIRLFHSYKKIPGDFSNNFFSFGNNKAVNHLFSVTSGIDSMVIGEYQIVNQVKEAYIYCTENSWTDAILMRLFQKAFETSKLVRSKTSVQKGATSISYLPVEKCHSIFNNLKDKKVLFVGTGETGKLVLQKMKKSGMSDFTFTNRTISNMIDLAKENKGKTIDFFEFNKHISDFDIIVAATNAGKLLIHSDDIKYAARKRGGKKQVYIDLSVPRNIQIPDKEIESAGFIVIDDLQEIVHMNATKREDSVKDAKLIIDEMTDTFYNWYNNRSLKPVIQMITKNIQSIHDSEITGYSSSFNTETYNAVNQYAKRLTQKYIRNIVKNLIVMNEKGQAEGPLDAIKELFIFEPNND